LNFKAHLVGLLVILESLDDLVQELLWVISKILAFAFSEGSDKLLSASFQVDQLIEELKEFSAGLVLDLTEVLSKKTEYPSQAVSFILIYILAK